MSIVTVHAPHTWGDDTDQANDNLPFAGAATATVVAYDATTTRTGDDAPAETAIATGEAFRPERILTY